MNKQQIENYLPLVLRSSEARSAVGALERLRSAIGMLHRLSPEALSVLRRYVIEECMPKKGAAHEFAKGYLRLVDKEIADKKEAEKNLYRGITGKTWQDPSEDTGHFD